MVPCVLCTVPGHVIYYVEVDLLFINEGRIFCKQKLDFLCIYLHWKEDFANGLIHSAGSWQRLLVVVKEK